MSDLPAAVHITEEGPREGFQIEKGPIPTARKIELIDALSQTGLDRIQIVSFVNPKNVPGMADAEEVVDGITPKPGVAYTALWLNEKGFERALNCHNRLTNTGTIQLCASEKFSIRNQNRTAAQQLAGQHAIVEMYKAAGIPVERGSIMAAFGCNFEGDIPVSRVVALTQQILDVAAEHGVTLKYITLADTMAWATPLAIKRTVGALRERWPDLDVALHLHDTRGLAIADAYAGLEMGVTRFDAAVAGLGGCPFAGHAGAAGNVCTEDLVFLCEEMGIKTGIDLDALIECAKLAEDIVGHPLPGAVMKGGTLESFGANLLSSSAKADDPVHLACDYWMPAFAGIRGDDNYFSPKIFQIPLAEATMRAPTFSLPSMNSTERVARTTSQCASTKSPIFTPAMNWMFISMVAWGLSPVERAAGHAHGLIGEASSACRRAACRDGSGACPRSMKPNRPSPLRQTGPTNSPKFCALTRSQPCAAGSNVGRRSPPCRSCAHLAGARRARDKPPGDIGNELFGIDAGGQRAAIAAERAHRLDVAGDLARLAHGLRIIGGEDELRERKLVEAERTQSAPHSAA